MKMNLRRQNFGIIFNIIVSFYILLVNGTETPSSVQPITSKHFPTVRPSLFPYVPPYINFCKREENCDPYPVSKRWMKWKLTLTTPKIVRDIVKNSGFQFVNKSEDWTGQYGSDITGQLKNYQKLFYLPCIYNIVRKDALWRNFEKFKNKFGDKEFGYMPDTYILPRHKKLLQSIWDDTTDNHWIVKPAASSRARGIQLVNEWSQVPQENYTLVQKYIRNPLLLNKTKFDIRIYAVVTSFNPLKIYMYTDGLLRFAASKYSNDRDRAKERCTHITNSHIMEECGTNSSKSREEVFVQKERTLKELWRHLNASGHNTEEIWSSMEDVVVKTMIVAQKRIVNCRMKLPSRYNSYSIYGFDILLDENLKPWVLEVNFHPSLHPYFDEHYNIKSAMIKELLNMVGYHYPTHLPKNTQKLLKDNLKMNKDFKVTTPVFDERFYCTNLSRREILKQNFAENNYIIRNHYLSKILKKLTPDDVRYLIQAEDELSQCNGFKRVFPSENSYKYLKFMDSPRYYNQLLDAWEFEYGKNRSVGIERLRRFCKNKYHLRCEQEEINDI